MKIGFNLLLWTTFVEESDFHLFKTLKEVGYDGVEIPLFEGETAHYQKIGQALADEGLGATAVTVIPDLDHSLISADASARAAGVERLKWALDCCQAMNAEVLCGPYHQPLGEFTGEGPTQDEKDRAVEGHRQVAEYAQQVGVTCAVEYLNRFECYFLNTMADAAEHVRRVDHPSLGTMYDSFHGNIEEKDLVNIIEPHIDIIRHVHISDNDRGTPGRGHIDFAPIISTFKKLGYDQWLTIEAFGRALPDLAAATRVWRDFFPSQEQVYTEGIDVIRRHWG